ncbi:DUF3618 domain-containing protein [Plantactinospora solaniradicis]|uniref:DUF3618 domain-containing protein n=1 Tax=Plantactinospora solaniradicis TaxID=1723736 RepID=A0ABW1KA30_9ACTN
MTTGDGAGDMDQTRAEIDKRRAELGETVQALAARTDVQARGREKAAQVGNRARERSAQATSTVREKATQVPKTAGQKLMQVPKTAGQKVVQLPRKAGQMAVNGAKTAGQQGARGAQAVGASANRAGGGVRRNPVPFAIGAVAAIVGVSVARRRSQAARAKRRTGRWDTDRLIRMARPVAPWWSAAAGSVKRLARSRTRGGR